MGGDDVRHYFSAEVAAQIGLHEALILEHINFWIEENYRRGRGSHDGRFWMFESVAQMAEAYPYLTPRQVRSALQSLIQKGVIICGNYNQLGRDRTKWYAITDYGHQLLNLDEK